MKTMIDEQIELNEAARKDLLELRKEYFQKGDMKNYKRITAELRTINQENNDLKKIVKERS